MFWSRYWWNNSENGLVRGNGDYLEKWEIKTTQKKREKQSFRMLLHHSRRKKQSMIWQIRILSE